MIGKCNESQRCKELKRVSTEVRSRENVIVWESNE